VTETCDCDCHVGPYAACTVAGGCGHLHEDDSDHRCRRNRRCADYTWTEVSGIDDDAPTRKRIKAGAWTEKPRTLCRMCTTHVERAIEQAPADYAELCLLLGKTSDVGSEPVSGSRELPVPIRLGVEALSAAILDELERWAHPVAEACGGEYSEAGRPSVRIGRAAGWLSPCVDTLLDVPLVEVARIDGRDETLSGRNPQVMTVEDGVDGAIALLELHERVRAVAGRTVRATRLWSPCPRCECLALERPEGADQVDCRRCAHRMTIDEYDRLSNVLLDAFKGAA